MHCNSGQNGLIPAYRAAAQSAAAQIIDAAKRGNSYRVKELLENNRGLTCVSDGAVLNLRSLGTPLGDLAKLYGHAVLARAINMYDATGEWPKAHSEITLSRPQPANPIAEIIPWPKEAALQLVA